MKFFYSALMVVGLVVGSSHAMDSQPELVDTVLELVWRHGDLDFDTLCAVAGVRKNIRHIINLVNSMKEREEHLKKDYSMRLKEKQFDHGALLTLRKDRLAYGFISVKARSEENHTPDEDCGLFLWYVKLRYEYESKNRVVTSHPRTQIMHKLKDHQLADEKYPWIENFKNPEIRLLKYGCTGNLGLSDSFIQITKPFFTPDGALSVRFNTQGVMYSYRLTNDCHW